MESRMRSLLRSGFVLGAVFSMAHVHGHHSTTMFDSSNPIELSGTVVDWQFENPHVFIILAVEDAAGDTVVWDLEGPNVNGLTRSGWTPKTLQPGDELVVTVNPLHSGAPGGSYRNVRWAVDGSPVDPRAGRPASAEPSP